MLDAHLDRCAECREYDADVTRITTDLRAAPLERMETPVVIRRPRRLSALRLQASVAAAMAVAVLGAASQLTREVNQIIADGHAFGDVSGSALPI